MRTYTPLPFMTLLRSCALTWVGVTLIWKRYEQWILFGRISADTIINRRTRVIAFRPSAVFAFVRWSSNDYGTIYSCIDIVTAVAPGEAYTTLPFVRPGADILLHIEGWPKVAQVLQAVAAKSEERRVGKGGVSTWRFRWWP